MTMRLYRVRPSGEKIVRLQDILPYLGRRCQMMVCCDACGGVHVHEGTLAVARKPGEVQLDGRSFTLRQIRALVASPTMDATREDASISRRAFNLLWQAGVLLAALSAFRAFWS